MESFKNTKPQTANTKFTQSSLCNSGKLVVIKKTKK